MNNCKQNIYDYVIIMYFEETNYTVMNTQDVYHWKVIWNGKDLETAKVVRQAYCDGYVDGENKGE